MVSFDKNKSSNNKIEYMEKVSLSPDNILLTGTQLKNTENVFGVCVYAGKETKIHLQDFMIKLLSFSIIFYVSAKWLKL